MKTTDSFNSQDDTIHSSILRADTNLTGDLFFSGKLHIFGSVTGNIISNEDSDSYLVLEKGSEISGEIRASYILVRSKVSGDIFCYKRLSLQTTATIQGDVHYKELEMQEGSTINGSLSAIEN
jgi:cytoskeletal protein CcmA (bactofilin family)